MRSSELRESKGAGVRYWRFGLMACSVVIVFVLVMVGLFLFFVYRSPYYRDLYECRSRMRSVGAALERYATKNDEFPARLTDLVPDYILASALHCPADKSQSSAVSYVYTRQDVKSPPGTKLLSCSHHRPRRGAAPFVVYYARGAD